MGIFRKKTRKIDDSVSEDPIKLVVVEGIMPRILAIDHFPFTVGRETNCDLILTDPPVSRKHAQFVRKVDGVWLTDQASTHGTYVNGKRIVQCKLEPNDRATFGIADGPYVIFNPDQSPASTAQQLLSQVASWKTESGADVDMLNTFLKAARKLNSVGVLDEVLHALLESALRRTHADRVFVFIRHNETGLRLLAGRDKNGQAIEGGDTNLPDAAINASEFLEMITDNTGRANGLPPYSPDRFVCFPLCQVAFYDDGGGNDDASEQPYVQGVVCFDYPSRLPSMFSYGVIKEMVEAAGTLIENAALMKAENAARHVRQEMIIAANIQQRLMTVITPDVPYAEIKAVSRACKDIGGDFFDLVHTNSGLSLIVVDVSGKGIAAAVVAAILQGMLYSHLARNSPLPEITAAVNRFLYDKVGGEKFATLVIARLAPCGELEFINCGHVPPLVISGDTAKTLEEANLPVGLFAVADFQATRLQLSPGDRLLVVTDGVTEAENAAGEFFGTKRLEACGCEGFAAIERAVTEFRAGTPFNDDYTITEMVYGRSQVAHRAPPTT